MSVESPPWSAAGVCYPTSPSSLHRTRTPRCSPGFMTPNMSTTDTEERQGGAIPFRLVKNENMAPQPVRDYHFLSQEGEEEEEELPRHIRRWYRPILPRSRLPSLTKIQEPITSIRRAHHNSDIPNMHMGHPNSPMIATSSSYHATSITNSPASTSSTSSSREQVQNVSTMRFQPYRHPSPFHSTHERR